MTFDEWWIKIGIKYEGYAQQAAEEAWDAALQQEKVCVWKVNLIRTQIRYFGQLIAGIKLTQ